MLRFVLRRCILVLPSLAGLLLITFLLIHSVPSDPAVAMAGDAGTPEQIARLRQQYGLDRPIWEQFFVYVGKAATFDFGESVFSRRPVATDILQRLPATLELTFAALALSIAIGVPLGVAAALKHNAWPDYLLRVFSVVGIAMAAFWVAIMLQALLRHGSRLAAIARRSHLDNGATAAGDRLPVIGCSAGWPLGRLRRSPTPSRAAGGDAVAGRSRHHRPLHPRRRARHPAAGFRLLRARHGYRWRRLVWVFILRNSVTATVTQIGLLFGGLIAGGVVVEAIFDWPGIGSYTVQAILTGDKQVMLAVTLLVGTVYSVVNIMVDVVHGLLDPRLMEQG